MCLRQQQFHHTQRFSFLPLPPYQVHLHMSRYRQMTALPQVQSCAQKFLHPCQLHPAVHGCSLRSISTFRSL
ncbi:hypothetical protein NECAME_15036 [Necator americanus]|uniref:Uncharacterized protein n=1 Tax=Necator americanus TaxID=51031 RepID=W2SLX9_NECAM|nr:hypothetical protein NECAME_15036 [Necator americanus]ETN69861.1 hypothetical protein NECAME_15036 [Necator americanus]